MGAFQAGGYRYRICPAGGKLTEECFQKPEHQLDFASDEHVVSQLICRHSLPFPIETKFRDVPK